MATETLALPTQRRLLLQFTELWGVWVDMGRQDQEVLALKASIEDKRLAAKAANARGDAAEVDRLLDAMATDTRCLEEVEKRDIGFRAVLRNLYHLMETYIKGERKRP